MNDVMPGISNILDLDAVRARLVATSKKALFQQLATIAAGVVGGDAAAILDCMNAREKADTTGFGAGVAIPHCRHRELGRVRGVFARLAEPVDYSAVDGAPVDLVFLLLSPPDAGADHLRALAAVSRLLRDADVVAKLRGARTSDAIYAVLTGEEPHDAG